MEKYGIKASLYDFFGYFIPGIVFYLLLNVIYYISSYSNYILLLINIDKFLKSYVVFSNSTCIALIIILTVILVYITGLLISFFSSLIFGKLIKANKLRNILSNSMYTLFKKLYKLSYKYEFMESDFRICITEVECFAPTVNNTAFTFLSLYGLHRSLSLTFLLFAFIQLILIFYSFTLFGLVLLFILLGLAISFFFGYMKFHKYYLSEIACTFITINTTKKVEKA